MRYKKLLIGFGIIHSVLLFFLIFSFLDFRERKINESVTYRSNKPVVTLKGYSANMHPPRTDPVVLIDGDTEQVKKVIFILASLMSLLPFFLFFTVVTKKFRKYRKKQNELMHVNRNKDLFFSIISHDLKSPAQNLIALSEIICKYDIHTTEEERTKINQLIHHSALKHYELLVNLLDWSRTQYTGSYQEKSLCIISDLADVNIAAQSTTAREKGIHISNLIEKSICIKTNETMLSTVFRNLLANAIKFTRPQGKIFFYCKTYPGRLDIYVEDTGVGMNKETLEHLFDLKYIRSLRGTQKETGTGIGLILCKEILTKLKGELKVISRQNSGSKFIIRLPL